MVEKVDDICPESRRAALCPVGSNPTPSANGRKGRDDLVSQVFVFGLMAVAAIVAAGLARKKNMWRWIVTYWVLLTMKNAVDFFMR